MSALGLKILQMAAGLSPSIATTARQVGLRLMKGEMVPDAELLACFPSMRATPGPETEKASQVEALGLLERRGDLAIAHVGGAIYATAGTLDYLVFGTIPTSWVVETIDEAVAGGARRFLWNFHCPGGSKFGADDLTAAVARLVAAGVEIHSIAHDLMASMGVWLACAAGRKGKIYGTRSAVVGSIGEYCGPIYDDSKMLEGLGVKAHVISTSARKTRGSPGVPVKAEDLDDLQRLVQVGGEEFFQHVAEARGLSVAKVRALDARVYSAADAKELGLIDRVVGYDELVRELEGKTAPRGASGAPSSGATSQAHRSATRSAPEVYADSVLARIRELISEGVSRSDALGRAHMETGRRMPREHRAWLQAGGKPEPSLAG